MIKSGSSNIRKFQFFEVLNNPDSIENIESEDLKDNNEKESETSKIFLNNITLSEQRQMKVVDDLIFINGKAIYKKEGGMKRENLIMKISDNKIVDAFRMFNVIYYDFTIKKYKNINYFIIIGSNFNEFNINNKKQFFMLTSIKIYDATLFLKDKEN